MRLRGIRLVLAMGVVPGILRIAGSLPDDFCIRTPAPSPRSPHYIWPQGTKIYVTNNPGLNIAIEAQPPRQPTPPTQRTPFVIRGQETMIPLTGPYRVAPPTPGAVSTAAAMANGGNDPRIDAMALQAAGIANPAIKSRLK